MSWRCGHGFHTYRHLKLTRHRWLGIPNECPTWTHLRRCKRCGHEREFIIFRYPRIKISQEAKP